MPASRRHLLAFAAFVALVCFYAFTIPLAGERDGDFVHLWSGGRLVASGRADDLYAPAAQKAVLVEAFGNPLPEAIWQERQDLLGTFFYPPPATFLYAPLGLLPMRLAAQVQAALSLAMVLGVALLLARLGRVGFLGSAILLLLAPAVFFTFVLGQNGVLTCLVLAAALLLLDRRRDLAAGLALGLLVYKPSWLFAVGWIPLVLGRWRALAGMALGAGLLCEASGLLLGWRNWVAWFDLAPQLARLERLPGYPLDQQFSGLALFRRLLGVGTPADLLGWSTNLLVAGAAAVRMRALPLRRALALGLAAACWVNPHLHHYELGPTAVALVLGLADWPAWSRAGKATAVGVVAFHHAAFLLAGISGLPWPTFATLVVGGWLAWAPRGLGGERP